MEAGVAVALLAVVARLTVVEEDEVEEKEVEEEEEGDSNKKTPSKSSAPISCATTVDLITAIFKLSQVNLVQFIHKPHINTKTATMK